MARGREMVLRHSAAVRWTHWTVALSGLALLFSGFGELPMYKRYNVVKLPGLSWAGDFEIHLVIHYIAAAIFTAAVVFHLLYHLRRREFSALPRRGDGKLSWRIIKSILLRRPEPASGKFLAEQRLAYAAIGGVTLLLVLTGLVKVYKNLGNITLDPTVLQILTLVHTVGGMLFMMLLLAHLAAFLLKANWPLLPSMITGRVPLAYASHRHSLWDFRSGPQGETATEERARRAAQEAGESGPAVSAEAAAPARPRVTVKDVLRFVPGVMILASVALGLTVSPYWFALTGFVGVNLLQSAFTKWCLLERILIRLGLPE